jgi:hypothetical protein
LDNTANNFHLSQVQLEVGAEATPFEYRTIQEEIALCERYYEKSYNLTTAPGATGSSNYPGREYYRFGGAHTGDIGGTTTFQVSKRAAPTMVFYCPVNGTPGKCYLSSSGTTDCTLGTSGHRSMDCYAAASSDSYMMFHFTADAEI